VGLDSVLESADLTQRTAQVCPHHVTALGPLAAESVSTTPSETIPINANHSSNVSDLSAAAHHLSTVRETFASVAPSCPCPKASTFAPSSTRDTFAASRSNSYAWECAEAVVLFEEHVAAGEPLTRHG
jgi:hypothetical protein